MTRACHIRSTKKISVGRAEPRQKQKERRCSSWPAIGCTRRCGGRALLPLPIVRQSTAPCKAASIGGRVSPSCESTRRERRARPECRRIVLLPRLHLAFRGPFFVS